MNTLKVNTLYSAQFNSHPSLKILEKVGEGFYKVLMYPYDGQGEAVERVVEEYIVKMLCFREYNPNLQPQPYKGPLSKEDIEIVQSFFDQPVNEAIIRSAISENNWGGDWDEVLAGFGISGDTCNREFVVECLEKRFKTLSKS